LEIVLRMRQEGLTYQAIADVCGVSRQRIQQICASPEKCISFKRWGIDGERRKGNSRGRKRVWKDKKDYHRHNVLIINGKYRKVRKRDWTGYCEICGKVVEKRLHYHHWDDDNPQWGIWVCQRCHIGCEFMEHGFGGKYTELKVAIQNSSNK